MSVNLQSGKVFIEKIDFVKKDGATKVQYPFNASNLLIVELDTSDKKRLKQ